MNIDLGWGRKSLKKQLSSYVFKNDFDYIEEAEKDIDAALRLHMRSIITDSMFKSATKNIIRRLEKGIDKPALKD